MGKNAPVFNENATSRPNTVQYWKDEIIAGLRYRRMYGRSAAWTNYKNMFRGIWPKGIVPVNIVYSIGRSLVPQIYFRNPRISISAKKPGYSLHAQVLERIDNHIIDETDLKDELKALILDNYLCGVGPIICGYDTEFGFNPSFSADGADSTLTNFNKGGQKIEYIDSVKPGMPWALRANPGDFVVPWGTHKFTEARWFAFRKMRLLRDIKEDPKYTNKGDLKAPYKTQLEGRQESKSDGVSYRRDETGAADQWVEIYQIHDKRTGKVFVISLDHDKFLRNGEDHLQIEGLPAHVLTFNNDTDYFWAPPDVRMIEAQQKEMNDIRTMAMKHRRVALLKVIYDKMIFKDEEDIEALFNGDPKIGVGINVGAMGDIRKSIHLFQSHVPPDFNIAAREVREDVREEVGFSRNQMGSFEESSGRRTATEANIVKSAAMIRIDERRDAMADILTKVIRTENQYIFANWTEERVVDIVGEDGARYWIRFTGKEIKGEFNYKVNPEEAIPENKQTRRQDAIQFIELATKVPGMDMGYILQQYARQFDWLDPKMLMPGAGAGRSPEKALLFQDALGRGKGRSQFPGLAGGGQ